MSWTTAAAATLALTLLLAGCGGGFPRESPSTRVATDNLDARGYRGRIAVTFEGNRIKGVVFEEVNKAGRAKSRDGAYARQMEQASRTTPAKVAAELASRLVAAQDPAQVQAVTGATQTSTRFKDLALQAVARR